MKNRLLWEIGIAFILSYVIVFIFFSANTKFEELAMGTETSTYQAMDSSKTIIHLQHWDSIESALFFDGWQIRKAKPVTLFLGNSQTHSINQMKDTDVNYVELLSLKNRGANNDVLCVSQPNAGMEQFYLSYSYIKSKVSLRTVVIPVFMDDMREEGIRADVFFQNLIVNKYQIKNTNDIAVKINNELQSYWPSVSQVPAAASQHSTATIESTTLQERTEASLNAYLDNHSQVWGNRQNVRGDFFNWIYKLRNTVLRINANTVRKMIPLRYGTNMQALQLIVEDCIRNKTKVILYIPPIRSDVPLPYNPEEYAKFKEEISAMATRYPEHVLFANYESIVPGNLWGYKEATNLLDEKEIDFMHFQFKGHQILADSLQVQLTILNQLK